MQLAQEVFMWILNGILSVIFIGFVLFLIMLIKEYFNGLL